MERKNENGDAPDQEENAQMDENAQNPESPEIITLSSDEEDEEMDVDVSMTDRPNDEMDVEELVNCLPSTSSDPSESKKQFYGITLQVKKELVEETSKTEVSSHQANHLDVNKAPTYLSEVAKRLKNFQQQSSAASYAAESSVSLPNSNDSQNLSEAENNTWTEQQPSSSSTAASSADAYVNNSTTVTAPNHSSVSSQMSNSDSNKKQPTKKPNNSYSLLLQGLNEVKKTKPPNKSSARPVQAVPRVLLRNCDQDAMEMGAEVWRPEKIVWAPFGKNRSYWPGTIFQDFDIKKVNKPKHKFVLWFGSHNYSEIRKDRLFDFRQHFEEKFDPKIRPTKKKAVLEALKILAEMSHVSQNSDLFDWGIRHFPGFQNRDEVLIEFLRPILERLKALNMD